MPPLLQPLHCLADSCSDTNLRHCRKQNSSKNIKWKDIRDSYHQPRGGVQALCQSYYKCLSLSLYLSLPLSDFTCVLVLVFVFVIVWFQLRVYLCNCNFLSLYLSLSLSAFTCVCVKIWWLRPCWCEIAMVNNLTPIFQPYSHFTLLSVCLNFCYCNLLHAPIDRSQSFSISGLWKILQTSWLGYARPCKV